MHMSTLISVDSNMCTCIMVKFIADKQTSRRAHRIRVKRAKKQQSYVHWMHTARHASIDDIKIEKIFSSGGNFKTDGVDEVERLENRTKKKKKKKRNNKASKSIRFLH